MQDEYSIDIFLGKRIKEVRQAKGLTQRNFAESLGIVQGFLSGIERGRKVPSDTLLIALVHCYKINKEWLYSGRGEMFSSGPSSDELVQKLVLSRIPLLNKIPQDSSEVAAEGNTTCFIALPDAAEGCYAIRMAGDFMAPTIRDGDLLMIDPNGEISNKDIVLVNNRWGDAILRRYRKVGADTFFSPDNNVYAPFKDDGCTRILGKVTGIWRKIRM